MTSSYKSINTLLDVTDLKKFPEDAKKIFANEIFANEQKNNFPTAAKIIKTQENLERKSKLLPYQKFIYELNGQTEKKRNYDLHKIYPNFLEDYFEKIKFVEYDSNQVNIRSFAQLLNDKETNKLWSLEVKNYYQDSNNVFWFDISLVWRVPPNLLYVFFRYSEFYEPKCLVYCKTSKRCFIKFTEVDLDLLRDVNYHYLASTYFNGFYSHPSLQDSLWKFFVVAEDNFDLDEYSDLYD